MKLTKWSPFVDIAKESPIVPPPASQTVAKKDFCLINSTVLNGPSCNANDESPHSCSDKELSPNSTKPNEFVSFIDVSISLISKEDLKAQLLWKLKDPSLDLSDGLDRAASSPCESFGDELDDLVDEMYSLNVNQTLEKAFGHRGGRQVIPLSYCYREVATYREQAEGNCILEPSFGLRVERLREG
ncbi:hypothetical protein IEQ34_011086 [Dendrobium chrysotoxum]|uniref:Uncharacterized protein n=1 Tax=Dendrobium chrysotoxum TaxID=161865 RepID=A0AAV7GXR6_DENCH|nr:hypothetical protein IEQ34_011086 [Dendrobium chrysotoxum]